ncbi:MAG: hypothetical protein GC190_14155 [Alphaproteobacteria bacterium]|nr:hypothetical protein [Alphaproteobacteria bacterium]
MTFAPALDRRSASSLGQSLAGGLTVVAVVLAFLVSGLMLEAMGVAYDTSGGALWQKIHPATYVALLALICLAMARLDVIGFIDDIARWHKGTMLFLASWLLLFVHVAVFVHSSIAPIVDTFLLPVMFLFLLTRISERQASNLAVFVHAAMTANALIALFEFATGARLTPLVAENVTLVADWRSSALFGHPLQNALITATYTLIMLQGGGRDLSRLLRLGVIVLQFAALIVFGGRVATLLLVAFGGVALALQLWQAVRLRRLTSVNVAIFVAALTAGVVGLVLLIGGGFFDLFAERFVQDQGSADARLAMFDLLNQMPFFAFLFGSDPEHVATLQRLEGIEFGIESFWVAFVAFYGLVVSLPFFAGLTAFLFDLNRVTRAPAAWSIIFFISVCSTSLSLAGKTTSFGMFAVMLLLLLRPLPEPGTRT